MPAEFNQWGISFAYPENWTLDDESTVEGVESVSLYSPKGAIWSVSLHSKELPPEALVEAVYEALESEYKEVESELSRQTLGQHELPCRELNFYCLDLTNTVRIFHFEDAATIYLVVWQAEDRDWRQIEDVFHAITSTLLDSVMQ